MGGAEAVDFDALPIGTLRALSAVLTGAIEAMTRADGLSCDLMVDGEAVTLILSKPIEGEA